MPNEVMNVTEDVSEVVSTFADKVDAAKSINEIKDILKEFHNEVEVLKGSHDLLCKEVLGVIAAIGTGFAGVLVYKKLLKNWFKKLKAKKSNEVK